METKPILGFAPYTINTNGEIYNSITGELLNQSTNRSGYKVVSIYGVPMAVHKIMYKTFLMVEYHTRHINIDHIDGNPSNNKLSNLRGATPTNDNSGNYRVKIKLNKWVNYNNTFNTLAEAVDDAKLVRLKYFGLSVISEIPPYNHEKLNA